MVTNRSTTSYPESNLTTLTKADRSVTNVQRTKAFHQHSRYIPRLYILMENQSTVEVFCNSALLWNIHISERNLHLSCNDGTVLANQVGDLPGYERVWYQPKGIANIIGLSNVSDSNRYWVQYEYQ